ncbi:MAG: L-histidine N(alpha)-methyltransferase [Gammaproteobacteria bacterium]|nr:L-histidine N(alpha)-methyltransferase [Gammaproteobacteria bacterium]MDE0193571.1 L-histidine N(alpha)-methyltransferase [Gammaproteobacteria bacterium]
MHNGEATPRYQFFDLKPALPDMTAEVLHGLTRPAKSIPPKYFYDAEGSRLFDVITGLPDYYLTRTETSILRENAGSIADRVGKSACLVEYGSGSSTKSRLVIEACRPAAYVPVDISRVHLEESAKALLGGYPELAVYPMCADYTAPFELPPPVAALPRLAFFPGSSIGNFEPPAARDFLRGVTQVVGPGGWLVLGVDTKKDPEVLDRAYTDPGGVTERFNKNLLRNVNNAVGADFDPSGFRHSPSTTCKRAASRCTWCPIGTNGSMLRVPRSTSPRASGCTRRTPTSTGRRSSSALPTRAASTASMSCATTGPTSWCCCFGLVKVRSRLVR